MKRAFPSPSIATKTVLGTYMILFVIMAFVTLGNIYMQNGLLLDGEKQKARDMEAFILTAMRHPMLAGDQDIIQQQFQQFKGQKAIHKIDLVDSEGTVKRSTDEERIGLKEREEGVRKALIGIVIEKIEQGRDARFVKIIPIFNEPKCYGCHGREKPVLGALSLELDWLPAIKAVAATRWFNVLTSFFGLGILGFLIYFYLFRTLIRPIRILKEGMSKAAGGDLHQSLAIRTGDEIGQLTRHFNEMTRSLELAMRREQKMTVAEQQRSRELEIVNENLSIEIEQRINTQEKLADANRKLADIIDFLPDPLMVIDQNGIVIGWNKAMEEMAGVQKKDMIGKGDYEYAVPLYGKRRPILVDMVLHDLPDTEARYSSLTRKGRAIYAEGFFNIPATGEPSYKWSIAAPLYDNGGNIIGAIESIRDITERKKMEGMLERAAAEWQTTFDSLDEMICLVDRDGRILRANRSFIEAFEMSWEQIKGREVKEFMQAIKHKPLVSAQSAAGRDVMELYVPSSQMYLEITRTPISDGKGHQGSAVFAAKDITMRKNLDRQERLAQLGKLVADMAHEVNNPLMIISGRAQLSQMEDGIKQCPEIDKNLTIIVEECQRAKDIIQRLLSFSKQSKGEIREMDLGECVESVVALVEHQFMLSGIRIERSYGTEASVLADEKQLMQVVLNLFNNARDAMPKGGQIRVEIVRQSEKAVLAISDTGTGMSGETLERVFEPFFTTKEMGTGLGLSVCYGIIKNLGGELEMSSSPGKGTTARITLPSGGPANKGEKDVR
ncbi:MAG: ATP-binding protein [Deltaproteobacteria bacterium]